MSPGELRSLLPRSVVSDRSSSDVLQGLTVAASPGTAAGSGSSGSTTDSGADLLQGPLKDVNTQLSTLTSQIASLASVQQTAVTATQDNTQALGQKTSSDGSSGSSIVSTLGGIASSVLGGGLSPIISGLLSLFGGGSTPAPAAVTPFKLPASVDYQAGLTGPAGQIVPVDSGQGGQVRPQTTSSAPQVSIQVNAMDSQSFMDHSDEIASAVKAAILSSHSLNDVLAEL
jgi:hypothetical protein